MKACRTCARLKSLDDFYAARRNKDGRSTECKVCQNAKRAERYRRGPDKDARLRRDYGLSLADFEAMKAAQHGGCAVCGGNSDPRSYELHVDHDHQTGKVRGLLCSSCNRGIGFLADDPERLRAAADYLEAHRA